MMGGAAEEAFLQDFAGLRSIRRADQPIALHHVDEVGRAAVADPQAPLLDDVVALNAVIEPIIREHCGDWYFLSHLHLP